MLSMRSWAVFNIAGKGLPSAPYIQIGWSLFCSTYASCGGAGEGMRLEAWIRRKPDVRARF